MQPVLANELIILIVKNVKNKFEVYYIFILEMGPKNHDEFL